MARYAIPVQTVASSILYVEADSPEEAIELGWESGEVDTPSICGQCAGWGTSDDNSGIEISDWVLSDEEPWVVDD